MEAIYHANRLDWKRGVNEWVEVFDEALERSRYELCRTLVEIRGELLISSYFKWGSVSQSEGDYFAQLARHAEAKQEYLEAVAAYEQELSRTPDYIAALNNKGLALSSLGGLQTQLAQHQEALQSYTNAISAYNSALALAPDKIYAINNKGNALINLGNLQAELSQEQEAFNRWQVALAEFSRSLEIAPGDEGIRNLRDQLQEFLDNLYGGTE